jgi:hypothetical protein
MRRKMKAHLSITMLSGSAVGLDHGQAEKFRQ